MIVCGLDPGLFGACVALDENFKVLGYFDTPIAQFTKNKRSGKTSTKNDFAPVAMKDQLLDLIKGQDQVHIWLEVANCHPGEGVSSSFKSGKGWGMWIGIFTGLGLPYSTVHPRTWATALLKDCPSGEPKQRAMIKTQQLFGSSLPLIKPRGKILSLDGRADAALIAYYGMNQMKGTPCGR